MKKTLYDYNSVHEGETIYIIGSAPCLNDLTSQEREFLKDKTTIGVNYTVEGIPTLSYSISAHISPAVYLFEHTNPDMPIFVAFNEGEKRTAFSYMKDFFWDEERIVIFSSDPGRLPLSRKINSADISLCGNTSVILLSTHLAYIMGAARIVYIGFDERKNIHFWNGDEALEQKIQKNIRGILKSKKYWKDDQYYRRNDLWAKAHSVHKEFEYILGEVPGYEGQFGTSREVGVTFWGGGDNNIPGLPPASDNVGDLVRYIRFLTSVGIKTCTLADGGITVEAGCERIEGIA